MRSDRLYEWVAESDEARYDGLGVGLRETDEGVVFWDTGRDRVLVGEVKDDDTRVKVKTERFRWEFEQVSIDRWFEHWVNQMSPAPPEFETEDEMHEWYVQLMNGEV